jgi:hypothetical protein
LYVEDPENYDDSVVSAGADWETIETGKGKWKLYLEKEPCYLENRG